MDREQINRDAEKAMSQLSQAEIAYAKSPKRGEYRGFAALHDLFDANDLLPVWEDARDDETALQAHVNYCNAVIDEITRRILAA